MVKRCADSNCNSPHINRDGRYYRTSDSKWILRFFCRTCGKKFSTATFCPTYRQKKRRENIKVKNYLCSGVSIRRTALLLGIHRITVTRKLRFLAEQAQKGIAHYWEQQPLVETIQFDDLQTIEHTKCKPLSVTVAVDAERRKIIGLEVSSMPATGHLAKISRKKYGYRKDERNKGIANLLQSIVPYTHSTAHILSDEHPFYPAHVAKFFPMAKHTRFKASRSAVVGQGELKKLRFDPLFTINHTLAMLRANINRLFRRTWCTTKDPKRLKDHLLVYAHFHNTVITPA